MEEKTGANFRRVLQAVVRTWGDFVCLFVLLEKSLSSTQGSGRREG